jgi:hypothetical protein
MHGMGILNAVAFCINNPERIIMKYLVRLLCGVARCSTFLSAAIAAEGTAVSSLEGTVVSSLNAESYTYVEVSKNNQNIWIVGPLVAVKPGNHVRFEEGALMNSFYSKQLDRTFPEVMFVQDITVIAEKK